MAHLTVVKLLMHQKDFANIDSDTNSLTGAAGLFRSSRGLGIAKLVTKYLHFCYRLKPDNFCKGFETKTNTSFYKEPFKSK